jgi:hypothetical protein
MSGDGRGDLTGTTVGGGRYRLSGLLGEGGMASVHVGHDSVLDRPVAVKTLHSELGRESSFRERFRREAQAVARLNHTNIVSVFDSGEDAIDGRSIPYIVMELVDGDPLRTVLDRDVAEHGAMPTAKALRICADVLAALGASHEMGLVHRDIKPGNVMLTRRGVVKVMDFGIARALQSGVTSMTQTGMVVGTPQYLSPEQALGRGVDERSDLYSVGCMLFELLTGRLPFDGDSPLAVAYQHVQSEPPVPSTINHSLSPAVDALIARALRKNPADRFPSADAMREECERLATGPVAATTPLVIGEGPKAHPGHHAGAAPDAFAVFPGPTADPHTPTPTPYAGQGQGQPMAPTRPPMAAGGQPPMGVGGQGGQPMSAGGSAFGPPAPQPGPVPQQYVPVGYPAQVPAQQQMRPAAYPTRPTSTAQQGKGGNWKPLLVFSAVALVAVLVLLAIIGKLTHNHTGTTAAGGSPSPNVSYGDPSRTVDTDECSAAPDDFSDKNLVAMPDLTDKYIDSVEACIDKAGWKYRIKHRNEQLFGKGTVVDQAPAAYDEFDPKKTTITLYVSTGLSAG